ncbi:MAG: hypothetical protein JW806_09420 [Sedimentisphaerales bacterium]|nr:hypothetical protein [Sedimentisphaerales bacterium]
MVLGRKFKIWLTSFAVILVAFLLYRSNSDAIKMVRPDYSSSSGESSTLVTESTAGQIGQARLEYLERARFETVDERTRKLKRVVGFEQVLHKTGDEWELDKPYMHVFQDNLRYNVTSDRGVIEIENVEGEDPVPKSAVLTGNVIIHILPEMVPSLSDSFIYLDEVEFDSDRSMFSSDNDVNFISADAHLLGKELEVVYNNISNRLEYMKIKHINFLTIKRLEQIKPVEEEMEKAEPAEIKKVEPVPAAPVPVEAESSVTQTENEEESRDNLQCIFRDNVILEHESDEVVLASEIMISNLLFSSGEYQQSEPVPVENPADEVVASPPTAPAVTAEAANEPAGQVADQNTVEPLSVQAHGRAIALLNQQKPISVRVRCDGPMIIRPASAAEFDDYKPDKFRSFHDLPTRTLKWLDERNVLLAQQIDYDYGAEIATANGEVELVFYSDTEISSQEPFIISARKGAEFISAKNQAIFYGNVKGGFNEKKEYYDEENVFYGDKLTIDLAGAQQSAEFVGTSDVSHVSVIGPGVRLESVKRAGQTKLSHVRLKSKRIDYDRTTEDIVATGKGMIEYGNIDINKINPSKSAMEQPCFALVEGFDKLVWDTNSMRIQAFSDESKGIHIGYIPIEKDRYGNRITIDTRYIDIEYIEPEKGKTKLKSLYAKGGIVYYEQPRYEFVGRELYLNGIDEFLTVSGSDDMPCMLNGVFTSGIEYDIEKGTANAVLGKGIGVMPVRE